MVRTQIQLSEEQSEELKAIAAHRHLSVAAVIREAVDDYIGSSARLGRSARFARAMEAVGKYSSDVTDLGRDHDKYLSEGRW